MKTKPKRIVHFAKNCLDGLLNHELQIDDLVPGLENAIEPTWERIKNEKRKSSDSI